MHNFIENTEKFPLFAAYFVTALGLFALFLFIYVRITPYREISLIRAGNIAAAASLSGAILGFVIPLASAIANSVDFFDMLIWSAIALLVQLIVYLVVWRLIPNIGQDIPEGKIAQGAFLGTLSLAAGLLNAACMTY
jgi:putative membrane protein